MAPLTPRGKVVFGLAFALSAALCAGAAVALVKASDHDATGGTATPTPRTTFALGSPSPTPSPSPEVVATSAAPSPTVATTSAAPSPAASRTTAATPTPTTAATRSASPRPRATSSPRSTSPDGLRVKAVLKPQSGHIFTNDLITLTAHATDGEGSIRLQSLDWGDGSPVVTSARDKPCSAPPRGDCADFTLTHRYARSGTYQILLQITSGNETAAIPFEITISDRQGPSPTPTA